MLGNVFINLETKTIVYSIIQSSFKTWLYLFKSKIMGRRRIYLLKSLFDEKQLFSWMVWPRCCFARTWKIKISRRGFFNEFYLRCFIHRTKIISSKNKLDQVKRKFTKLQVFAISCLIFKQEIFNFLH